MILIWKDTLGRPLSRAGKADWKPFLVAKLAMSTDVILARPAVLGGRILDGEKTDSRLHYDCIHGILTCLKRRNPTFWMTQAHFTLIEVL